MEGRQADLLGENPREQERMSMMEKKFDGAVHDWAVAVSGYFERKGAVCPHWPDITNSLTGLRVLGAPRDPSKIVAKIPDRLGSRWPRPQMNPNRREFRRPDAPSADRNRPSDERKSLAMWLPR